MSRSLPVTVPWAGLVPALTLVPEALRVEVKLVVAPGHHDRARSAFTAVHRRTRLIWFLDTPDRSLHRAGQVVRARLTLGTDRCDVVVKQRVPVDGVRPAGNGPAELDALPDLVLCTRARRRTAPADLLREVAAGRQDPDELLSPEQRQFLGSSGGGLVVVGPVVADTWQTTPVHPAGRTTLEEWRVPGSPPLLELSTACAPADAPAVATATAAALAAHDLDPDPVQRSKTRMALSAARP